MKRLFIGSILAAIFIVGAISTEAIASDTGCKIVLCVSNPGGARQYAECHEPIDVLENCLKHHKPIPKCSEANAGFGRQFFYTCEEAYGEGYVERMDGGGGYDGGGLVCSKIIRYEYDYLGGGTTPIYENQPLLMREKPYYMETETGRYWFNLRQ